MSVEFGYELRAKKQDLRQQKVIQQIRALIQTGWKTITPDPQNIHLWYSKLDAIYLDTFKCKGEYVTARHQLLKFIRAQNTKYSLNLPEPSVPVRLHREKLTKDFSWMEHGQQIVQLVNQAKSYWLNHTYFSYEDTLAWTLWSAIIWSGLNDRTALQDFLNNLIKRKSPTLLFEGIAVFHLEASDSYYGNIITGDPLSRAYTFIPDDMTLCWLLKLAKHPKPDSPIHISAETLVMTILTRLNPTLGNDHQFFAKLLRYANYHWELLSGVRIQQALVRVLSNQQNCCSLSANEWRLLTHSPAEHPPLILDMNTLIKGNFAAFRNTAKSDTQKQSMPASARHFISDLKGIFNAKSKSELRPHEVLEKLQCVVDKYVDSGQGIQRLMAWVIHLVTSKLKYSTVRRYLSAILVPWLVETDGVDFNCFEETDYEDIYQTIIQTKLESGRAYTGGRLVQFHQFQVDRFRAPNVEIPLADAKQVCRSALIGLKLYHAMRSCLESAKGTVNDTNRQVFQLLLILAYRTGLRRVELIGLKIRDIIQSEKLLFVIRSNKDVDTKTESAYRLIPIWALLKADELKILQDRIQLVTQRNNSQANAPLLSLAGSTSPLPLGLPSRLISDILDHLLPPTKENLERQNHRLSLHSFRHTALSNIGLVLHGRIELIQHLTDYNIDECSNIRDALRGTARHHQSTLDNPHQGQDHWFALAQVAGHLNPAHTFSHYIHYAHLMGGYDLSQAQILMNMNTVQHITGYSHKSLKDAKNLSGISIEAPDMIQLSKLRPRLIKTLAKSTSALIIVPQDTLEQVDQPIDYFTEDNPLPETDQTPITIDDVMDVLEQLQKDVPISDIRCGNHVPKEFIETWQKRAIMIASHKTQQGTSRLFSPARLAHHQKYYKHALIAPSRLKNQTEQAIANEFFRNAAKMRRELPGGLYHFLKMFIHRVNVSRSEIRFTLNESKDLESFLDIGRNLISIGHWRLLAPTEKMARDLKHEEKLPKSLAVLGTTKIAKGTDVTDNDYHYNGYSLAITHPEEKQILEKKRQKLKINEPTHHSSEVLKYCCHLMMIIDFVMPHYE